MNVYSFPLTGAVAASVPVHWTKRGPGQCCWPIGEGADLLSCCAPTASGRISYCPDHAARSIERPASTPAQAEKFAFLAANYALGQRGADLANLAADRIGGISPRRMADIQFALMKLRSTPRAMAA